ncbi:CHAT domain-containing protein [Imhoffiella purpurea]|uniref:CHAT domain-containing protein n=1 Tax=Imhoffiella purpurea TaxID=1249627 RepID=W9VSE6_9GAMM|nr:CHAT domain-containing protein [Imhoffiella purpurea]EXJ13305.1 hypothetical protein D779_3896 [Imhoffiella purpurea]
MDADAIDRFLDRVGGPVEGERSGLARLAEVDEALADLQEGENWAALQLMRANILVQMPGEGAADYIEQAIASYERTLRFCSPETDPLTWARVMSNCSVAWRRRVKEPRAANLERAMDCLASIGDHLERERDPRLWASSQANLGNAFLQRIVGDPRENIEHAIGRYRAALEIFNPRDYPDLYCRCAANLAHAYEIRIAGDREENMEDAIALGRLALRICDALPANTEWARLHNNLGSMYRSRIAGNRADNVESAIGHYRAALRVWKRARFADDWARVQHNLGVAYRKRSRGDAGANLKRSRVHLRAALSVRTLERFPTDWLRSQHSLALTEMQTGNWPQVERIAREVMRFLGGAIAGLGNWYEMRRLIGAASATKNLGVLAIAERGNPADAFAFLIEGRGLVHRALLGAGRAPAALGPDDAKPGFPSPGEAVIAFCVPPLDGRDLPVFVACSDDRAHPVRLARLTGLDRAALESLFECKAGRESSWLDGYQVLLEQGDPTAFSGAMERVAEALDGYLAPLWQILDSLPVSVRRLRIAPSGPLSLFPPTMVRGGERKIMHRFDLASAVGGLSNASTFAARNAGRRLLVVADPTGDLPHSRAEGKMLGALFQGASSLLGKRATKRHVLDAISTAGPLDYLHFACHGRFRWRHPEASGLLMAGGEILQLSEILGRIRLGCDTLVVLSACESGIAEYRELPDETYGLPLAFLGAGASAVICSLWPVPDRSTRVLMLKLYEYLHAGASPPSALRSAQRWLRDALGDELQSLVQQLDPRVRTAGELSAAPSPMRIKWVPDDPPDDPPDGSPGERPFAHPFHWAGFVCIA